MGVDVRIRVVVFGLLGASFLLLGLLFLAGSAGMGRRLVIAAVFLLLGALISGLAVRTFRRWRLLDPEILRNEILGLAQRKNGEISMADIDAELGWRTTAAGPVVENLVAQGKCRRAIDKSADYLVFPELQPRLTVRFCEYCNAEYPISEETESCPNCGGTLDTRVAVRSLADGESFSMDE